MKKPKPRAIHIAVQSTLTVSVVATFAVHLVAPELEALAFAVSGVMAVWANDIERKVRHPHIKMKGVENA